MYFLSPFLIFFFLCVYFEIFIRERDLCGGDNGFATANPLSPSFPQDPVEGMDGGTDGGMIAAAAGPSVGPSIHPSTRLPDPSRCPFQPYRARRFPWRKGRRGAERSGAGPALPSRAPPVMSASLLPLPGTQGGPPLPPPLLPPAASRRGRGGTRLLGKRCAGELEE